MTNDEPAGRGVEAKTDRRADPLAPLRPRMQAIHKTLRKLEASRRKARSQRVLDSLAEQVFDLTCELSDIADTH